MFGSKIFNVLDFQAYDKWQYAFIVCIPHVQFMCIKILILGNMCQECIVYVFIIYSNLYEHEDPMAVIHR